jgi:hypothetical protein
MAVIDCTLNALKVPGFSGYNPPFGTKVAGPITSRDENNNILMPFALQRPKAISENSSTSQIQTNVVFEFTVGGITLTLGAAAFAGCRASVINSTDADCAVNTGAIIISVKTHESIRFEWANGMWNEISKLEFVDMIAYSLDLGGRAHQEIKKTTGQRIQTGIAKIINRGVIEGFAVEKSATALRNISLGAGKLFMNGMELAYSSFQNSALVPDNHGEGTRYLYAYIHLNQSGAIQFSCTPFDGSVPEDAMALYRLAVPPGNNYQNDPYLAEITITDMRRVEAAYPVQFNSTAYASVALPFNVLDAEYTVLLEVLDYKGGYNQIPVIHADDKAANGFNIKMEGTLDVVRVRWTVIKPNL